MLSPIERKYLVACRCRSRSLPRRFASVKKWPVEAVSPADALNRFRFWFRREHPDWEIANGEVLEVAEVKQPVLRFGADGRAVPTR